MKDEKNSNQDLRIRTKTFALRIIKLFESLPSTTSVQVLGKQILRSGTSVGAQYREACRAKSNPDFISKMEGALQELDETQYWMELIVESDIVKSGRLEGLFQESEELIAIFTTIVKKVKATRK
jgi:four helix bundle protein